MKHRGNHLHGTAPVNDGPESNASKFTVLLRIFSKKLVKKCLLEI